MEMGYKYLEKSFLQVLTPRIPKVVNIIFGILGVKIYANDISERMVSRAQNKNLENVEIIIGNNENLPYPDACCNKYISNLSLHITPDPRKMLQEAYHLLQPGGIAVFSIWGKPSDHNLFSILKRAQNSIWIFPQN